MLVHRRAFRSPVRQMYGFISTSHNVYAANARARTDTQRVPAVTSHRHQQVQHNVRHGRAACRLTQAGGGARRAEVTREVDWWDRIIHLQVQRRPRAVRVNNTNQPTFV